MKSSLSLIACLLLVVGCNPIVPATSDVKPPKPDAPVVKSQVTPAQFFTAFADHIAAGNIDHTQRVRTVCDKSMHEAGVSPPANYDTVMSNYTKVNKLIDADLRAKIVADLRGFAR